MLQLEDEHEPQVEEKVEIEEQQEQQPDAADQLGQEGQMDSRTELSPVGGKFYFFLIIRVIYFEYLCTGTVHLV